MPTTGLVPLKGDKVRELRLARGLSQLQLGELCGYGRSQIAKVEAGRAPSPRAAWNIATVLETPSEELTVSGLPVPEPPKSPNVMRTRVLA